MRLFIAIPLSDEIKLKLQELQQHLPQGVRRQPVHQMHITLLFLGETSPEKTAIIQKQLQHIYGSHFMLTLKGTGTFSVKNRTPKVIWAGVEKAQPLMRLQQNVAEVCAKNGLATEQRNYIPHVTIGKVKKVSSRKIKKWVDEHQYWEVKMLADRFVLYESRPKASGVIHEAVHTYLLQP